MAHTKAERHEMIRERARRALREMYHNATPSYPKEIGDRLDQFSAWFEDTSESELDYINSGGAYARSEREYVRILRHPANAGRYTSAAAQDRYVVKELASMRRERDVYAPWEWIIERYGKIYSWGRGGRTLAPESLIRTHGGRSFSINDAWPDDKQIACVIDLIKIVESFNTHVRRWCNSVPEMWAEYCATQWKACKA